VIGILVSSYIELSRSESEDEEEGEALFASLIFRDFNFG
jgi:hypothetical protein